MHATVGVTISVSKYNKYDFRLISVAAFVPHNAITSDTVRTPSVAGTYYTTIRL